MQRPGWDWQDVKEDCQIPEYPQEILDRICDYAIEQKIIEDGVTDRDIFDTEIMGKFTKKELEMILKRISTCRKCILIGLLALILAIVVIAIG